MAPHLITASTTYAFHAIVSQRFSITCMSLRTKAFVSYLHYIVVAAEVVDTINASDIVFPATPDQLGNFTAVRTNDAAQITIPAAAISKLSTEGISSGELPHGRQLIEIYIYFLYTDLAVVHIIFRNIEEFLPASTSMLRYS